MLNVIKLFSDMAEREKLAESENIESDRETTI